MSDAEQIIIKSRKKDGTILAASFIPSKGMNFLSYKKGDNEVIDLKTKHLFEERYAGCGAMIGPHFYHRKKIPPVTKPSLFPHIAHLAPGTLEPFSHGIGRYAPWKIEESAENRLRCSLSSHDIWNGVTLGELEGQEFTMQYDAQMSEKGLEIELSVDSEAESVVGLHTYYALPQMSGWVVSNVKSQMRAEGKLIEIPSGWKDENGALKYMLAEPIDNGFFSKEALSGEILLDAITHRVKIGYKCDNEENSCQLWQPPGASFVCIEPLSAKDPKNPVLCKSKIYICIDIL